METGIIIAGEDLEIGDIVCERDGLGYPAKGSQERNWLGFARDNTPKGKSTVLVSRLDFFEGIEIKRE